MNGGALFRHGLRLFARRRGTMGFFAGCLALGIAFLSAVGHLLAAVDGAVARRARELLAGDLQVSASRPMKGEERVALTRAVAKTAGRRASESVAMASMVTPLSGRDAPFLIAAKAVDSYYPLRGELVTAPFGVRPLPGTCLLERSAALQHDLKVGDAMRLGSLKLEISGLIDKEPDRDFLGFSFAPRLLISLEDLPRAKLLGLGARVRYSSTIALGDGEDPDGAAEALKISLSKELADPHLAISTYRDGEASVRDGLRRGAIFFTILSLAALLLGAAGLRAGLSLFLDAEGPSM
ncbi:MAG: ABC transporter permease, partial [Elusimicrobiota bacterium]